MNAADHIKEKRIEIKPIEYIQQQFQKSNETASPEEQYDMITQNVEKQRTELKMLKQQKEDMLDSAKKEIKQEKESWDTEKQLLIEQAHKEGYEAGFLVGKQESIAQYEDLLTKANNIIQSATKDYNETVEQSEDKIIVLATQIAEKIITQKIDYDPNVMVSIVAAAIKEIKEQSIISIYVHPNHYQVMLQQKKELENVVDGDSKMAIYIDHELTEQGCRIEHPFGQVDASVETQLSQIHDILQSIVMENRQ